MKILFIHIENTGFGYSDYDAYQHDGYSSSKSYDRYDDLSIYDVDEMPRLNSLNWILCDSDKNVIANGNHIFNWKFVNESNINPIDEQYLKKVFLPAFNEADIIVGHDNVWSDLKVVGTEFIRIGYNDIVTSKARCSYATSQEVTRWCAIKNRVP